MYQWRGATMLGPSSVHSGKFSGAMQGVENVKHLKEGEPRVWPEQRACESSKQVNGDTHHDLYSGRPPGGKHVCVLIAKREHERRMELLAEVEGGRYRGKRIRFCAIGHGKAERAAALTPGDRLVVVLRYKPTPVVTNFFAARQPTVVTVIGGSPAGDHGAQELLPVAYGRTESIDEEHGRLRLIPAHTPLVPAPEFPAGVIDLLRSELLFESSEGACDSGAEEGNESCGQYWNDRTLHRVALDYPLCVLSRGSETRFASFETTFARYCRGEGDHKADQPVAASVYQYSLNAAGRASTGGGVSPDYRSPVWARWLHVRFLADSEPEVTLARCRLFVKALCRLGVSRHQVLPFTLGAGDLEVMFPSAAAFSLPRPGFEFVAGYLCTMIAEWSPCCGLDVLSDRHAMSWTPRASQPIDTSLYAPSATVQMPNTRVERSGGYKVRVGLEELFSHNAEFVSALAASPRPFNPPPWQACAYETPKALWEHAVALAVCRSQSIDQITLANRWVYPGTFDFMFCGADGNDAGNRLFAAAMNLLDFGCPYLLLEALLSPAALMSGMSLAKVRDTLSNAVHTARKARSLPIEVWQEPEPEDGIVRD